MRRAPGRTTLLLLLAVFALQATAACAGTLLNKDKTSYEYAIFWDDLSKRASGAIEPGEKLTFKDASGIISIPARHDSIYVRPGDNVVIKDGVMNPAE